MSEFRYNNICQKRTELWLREELSMAIPKGKKRPTETLTYAEGRFSVIRQRTCKNYPLENDMSWKEREGEAGWTTTYSKKYGAVGAGLT